VTQWLRNAIADGHLGVGDPLPSERILATRLNISRTTVRAALRDMMRSGLINKPPNGRLRRLASTGAQDAKAYNGFSVMANTVAVVGTSDLKHGIGFAGWDTSIHFTVARLLEQAGHHVLAVNPNSADLREGASLALSRPLGVILTYDSGDSPQGQALAGRPYAFTAKRYTFTYTRTGSAGTDT
jgi:DNA-binding transcriptional MocR family regulator